MSMRERFERLAGAAARRPFLALGIVLALAVGGGLLALRLKPSTGTDTFVSGSSSSYQATVDDQRHFGSDAVVILIREPLSKLVLSKDLGTLSFLEACLAGQQVIPNQQLGAYTTAPASSSTPYGGRNSPCGRLMAAKPVQAVYGPGTFLNQAVTAVNKTVVQIERGAQQQIRSVTQSAYQLALSQHRTRTQALAAAKAAGTLANQQEATQAAQLALNSGLTQLPRIDDQRFISSVVFDATRGSYQPKARFSYLFPTTDSALIQVRLKSSLSDDQQARAIGWIRQAVRMPIFALGYGGTYTVSGAPVVLHDLASEITGSIAWLLIAALLVMAATLLLVFRSRLRLLPLGIALAAAGITFGLMSLVGASLTMASIAVLPILIGLAVDYAVQFQSRVQEARRADAGTGPDQISRAAGLGAPAIATAALATATGFLVLLLSPVPMVQGFGLLLVVGIAIALVCALTAAPAALALADREPGTFREGGRLRASLRGAGDLLGASLRGARALVARGGGAIPFGRLSGGAVWRTKGPRRSRKVLAFVTSRPGAVLAVAGVLALGGWAADTQTSVQSDVTKLVPSSMPALRNLHTLERVTGVSGEIDVTVKARDVTRLGVVNWMTGYEQALLTHFGYLETKGCAHATLCPALSLPDLFASSTQTSGRTPSQSSVDGLLAAVPPYFKQAVITPDGREATLAFGIRLMPLAKQQGVIDYMRSRLHPPAGVTAQLAGLPVLAAEADAALSSSARRLLTLLAGLVAVGLVLLAVFRRPERALVPLIPIALATGWSALILFAIRIPLNPMSATLGALVIAISTEFSVLLSERFRQERAAGRALLEALERTYRSTGLAVLASGITAIAGFGVLVLSNITMLRDFGFVTLIDLTVSLAGVLLVLPAALALAERGDVLESVVETARRAAARAPRPRRRRRGGARPDAESAASASASPRRLA
jgi:hydrophobe/amphiphile efflux-3 (HAE3) family protein